MRHSAPRDLADDLVSEADASTEGELGERGDAAQQRGGALDAQRLRAVDEVKGLQLHSSWQRGETVEAAKGWGQGWAGAENGGSMGLQMGLSVLGWSKDKAHVQW